MTSDDHTTPTRVFICDDNSGIRRGLRYLMQDVDDMVIVGEASNAADALREIPLSKPDVVVMDLSMPGTNGIEATAAIHAEAPDIKVIMYSAFMAEEDQQKATAAGVIEYVPKDGPPDAALHAVRAAMAGKKHSSSS